MSNILPIESLKYWLDLVIGV